MSHVIGEVGTTFRGVDARVYLEVGGEGDCVVRCRGIRRGDEERTDESRNELARHRSWEREVFS
jgi:hypothetical protein